MTDSLTFAGTDLPPAGDARAIFEFAMTFDGYDYCGSFEAAAELARAKPRSTVDDLRAELFFEARASRHRGDEDFVLVYGELLPCFVRLGVSSP